MIYTKYMYIYTHEVCVSVNTENYRIFKSQKFTFNLDKFSFKISFKI